jgi:hypothetical protein
MTDLDRPVDPITHRQADHAVRDTAPERPDLRAGR